MGSSSQSPWSQEAAHAYLFRTAQGVWINDMRNRAFPHAQWPCVVMEERTVRDLARCDATPV